MSNDKQTAVQILVDNLIKLGYLHSNEFGQSPKVRELINQAKEMQQEQAQQYAGFCVRCDREKLPLLDFESYILTYGGNK